MQLWRKRPPLPHAPSRHDQLEFEMGRERSAGEPPVSAVARRNERPASSPVLHAALFLLTLFSMTAAGAIQRGVNPLSGFGQLVHLVEGIPFAATLLGILTVHEFGHYFAARYWRVKASLPYFIPLPYVSFLGTLGAVIRIRSPIPHKRALLDIGASGAACRLRRGAGSLHRRSSAVARRRPRLFRSASLRKSRAVLAARRPPRSSPSFPPG